MLSYSIIVCCHCLLLVITRLGFGFVVMGEMMSLNELSAYVASNKLSNKHSPREQRTSSHRRQRGARPNSSGVLALLAIDGAFRLPKAYAEALNPGGGCLQNHAAMGQV